MEHKPNQNQKSKFRIPFSALLLYLALAAAVLSGVTFSKYMGGTALGDSARVAIIRDIAITETGNFAQPNQWVIVPGVDMIKNAVVDFEGSEMACYVFLETETNGWSRISDYVFAYTAADGEEILGWSVKTDWIFLSSDGIKTVYYRKLSANTELHEDILADGGKITVSENIKKSLLEQMPDELTIKISVVAAQYNGFTEQLDPGYNDNERAAAAWNAVKGN